VRESGGERAAGLCGALAAPAYGSSLQGDDPLVVQLEWAEERIRLLEHEVEHQVGTIALLRDLLLRPGTHESSP
jgi:hypothetical protein